MHRQRHDKPSGADKIHCSLKDASAERFLPSRLKGSLHGHSVALLRQRAGGARSMLAKTHYLTHCDES